ncbi:MAG: molybdopterin-dependent oxidoreductase, partial [Deltaproteobacteria bacterium]|nr:molybdopterin-dependent oxidoreductase [Deltaproteobacteria bacterium]
MTKYNVIGSRSRRLDAPAKATGQALYTDDLIAPGMLYGAILHSPLAHAKILNIDTSAAEKLSGVKAVVTQKDLPPIKYGVSPARYDETVFAQDKVRYVGDEIAAVAAVDLETAQEALKLIKVDYQPLEAVLTLDQALAEGAPLIHEEFPGNLCAEVHQEFGDFDQAIKGCDLVLSHTFLNKRQNAAFIEPLSSLAEFDRHGYLTLWSSTQSVHYTQRNVAMVLGLPIGKVRVKKPYVGGGFGPKAAASPLDFSASLLSIKTGRPVKMTFSREEVFLYSRSRHQFKSIYTIGAMKDGTIVGLHNQTWLEGGAYASFGIATVYYAGSLLGGPYRLKHMKYDGYRVYTNKPACGAQRGHGGVAARAHFEQQLDMVAEELGLDPVELRLKNVMEAGESTINELNMSSLGMRECLEAVRDGSGWREKRGKLPRGKGLGLACGFFVSGAGYPIYRSDTYHATVVVKLSEDGGTAVVETGSAEIGQGSDTAMAMIAAEALGVNLSDVRIVSGDTDLSVDLGAYSSRQTLMTGHATKEAAEDAKRQVLEVLSEELKVPLAEMDVFAGQIVFKGQKPDFEDIRTRYIKEHRGWLDWPQGQDLTFKEAARMAYLARGTIIGTGK